MVSVCATGLDTKERVLYFKSSSAMPGYTHTPTHERDLQHEVEADVNSYLAQACAHTDVNHGGNGASEQA